MLETDVFKEDRTVRLEATRAGRFTGHLLTGDIETPGITALIFAVQLRELQTLVTEAACGRQIVTIEILTQRASTQIDAAILFTEWLNLFFTC